MDGESSEDAEANLLKAAGSKAPVVVLDPAFKTWLSARFSKEEIGDVLEICAAQRCQDRGRDDHSQ